MQLFCDVLDEVFIESVCTGFSKQLKKRGVIHPTFSYQYSVSEHLCCEHE